jgi:hypothetical protein
MDAATSAARASRERFALFAENFGRTPIETVPDVEVISPGFSDADISIARAEAWAEGHAAGIAESSNSAGAMANRDWNESPPAWARHARSLSRLRNVRQRRSPAC